MIANIVIALVAFLHICFLVLEMFLWTKPMGLKTFRMSLEQAKSTASLAANQGLYNGFLSAGLFWSLIHPDVQVGKQLSLFFIGCVIVAAIYGAYSVGRKILYIQGIPAFFALVLVLWFK